MTSSPFLPDPIAGNPANILRTPPVYCEKEILAVRQKLPPYFAAVADAQQVIRADQIVLQSPGQFRGKRVLEIAPGFGGFSRAALHAGAESLTILEPRASHIDNFRKAIELDKLDEKRVRVVRNTISVLPGEFQPREFDTVVSAGLFYHIHNHVEFLQKVRDLDPSFFILDTAVRPDIQGNRPAIYFDWEDVADPFNAAEGMEGLALVGTPTRQMMFHLLDFTGWEIDSIFDFAFCRIPGPMASIREGRRVIYFCRPKTKRA